MLHRTTTHLPAWKMNKRAANALPMWVLCIFDAFRSINFQMHYLGHTDCRQIDGCGSTQSQLRTIDHESIELDSANDHRIGETKFSKFIGRHPKAVAVLQTIPNNWETTKVSPKLNTFLLILYFQYCFCLFRFISLSSDTKNVVKSKHYILR